MTKTAKLYAAMLVYAWLIGYLIAPMPPRAADTVLNVWLFVATYVVIAASIAPLRDHMAKYYPPSR